MKEGEKGRDKRNSIKSSQSSRRPSIGDICPYCGQIVRGLVIVEPSAHQRCPLCLQPLQGRAVTGQ